MSKKVGEMDNTAVEGFVQGASSFMLDENIELNLEKLKYRNFYRLLNFKLHQSTPAGLQLTYFQLIVLHGENLLRCHIKHVWKLMPHSHQTFNMF